MSIDTLEDKKWRKFLRRAWLFKFIPFVDFVLAAGSLATGNMREDSDFDVIVGVRQGRIFTVRMFCFIGFGMFGLWARHPDKSKDRLCFNHFVTPRAYRLSPPHNAYWQNLYANLVPVYGKPALIQRFFRANKDWMKESRLYQSDARHLYKKFLAGQANWIKRTREWLLGGKIGNWLEKILKNIQLRKMQAQQESARGYKPRIIVSDDELEFHPDTKRIEEYAQD